MKTHATLNEAGLQPQWGGWRVLLWNKMLLNIAINPIAGLLGKENGALLEPMLFESAVSVMLEGAMIAVQKAYVLLTMTFSSNSCVLSLKQHVAIAAPCCKTFAQGVKLKSTHSMEKFAVVVKWLASNALEPCACVHH